MHVEVYNLTVVVNVKNLDIRHLQKSTNYNTEKLITPCTLVFYTKGN